MNRDARNFLLDNMLANSTYWVGTGTVIAALMNYYALSASLTNLVVGLTATLPILQVVGARWYARSAKPQRVVLRLSILWRLLLPLTFFTVLLPFGVGAVAAPIAYLCTQIVYQLNSPIQNDWMVNTLGNETRKDYYSLRETVFMLVLTLASCGANLLLNQGQGSGEMAPAFLKCALLIGGFMLASLWPLLHITPPQLSPQKARQSLRKALRDKNFHPILLTGVVWTFAGMFNGSFAATYQITVLQMSFKTILIWSVIGNFTRTVVTMGMARLADKFSWKTVCLGCMGCMAASGFLWIFVRQGAIYPLFPICCLLSSLSSAGVGVGFFKLQLAGMPQGAQGIYFSANAVCAGVAACVGSALSSVLITLLVAAQIDLSVVFAVGAALGVAAMGLMCRVDKGAAERGTSG